MAGDLEKPNKVHTLFPEEVPQKMWPLPVRDLFLVGAATERKLKRLGMHTIGDLARADVKFLRSRFGKPGETLWHFANGRNTDAVNPVTPLNKGYGNSVTTAQDVVSSFPFIEEIEKAWRDPITKQSIGFVYDGTLTPKAMKYVSGYISKKGYEPESGKRP